MTMKVIAVSVARQISHKTHCSADFILL